MDIHYSYSCRRVSCNAVTMLHPTISVVKWWWVAVKETKLWNRNQSLQYNYTLGWSWILTIKLNLLPCYLFTAAHFTCAERSPLNVAQLQWRSNLCYRMQGLGLNLGLDSGLVSGIIMVINEPGCSWGVRCRTSHTRGGKRDEARLPRRKLSQVSHGAVLSHRLSK